MRKNQTLLVAGILLLASAGVAQAQAVYEAFGNAVMAREGGAGEKAGAIVLFLRSGDHNGGIVTVRYSAPLAAGTVATVNAGTVATDVDEGTVTVTMPSSGTETVTISDVRLDLREATVPVTATFSGNSNAFVSGVATVISAIEDALEVESTSVQILTRGGMGSATVTIKEAFASAFTAEADILLTLVGVPDKASLTVSHAGHPMQAALDDPPDETLDDADVAGNVTLNGDTTEIVDNAETTGAELMMTGDGDKINITVGFTGPNAASTESLKLMFDLAATAAEEDLMLPLDEGMVEVWVTMAPTDKPDMVDENTEYFAVNYIPADGVVAFTIAPASCTLLFPYAVSAGNVEYRHSHLQPECLYRYSVEWRHHVHPVSERWGDDRAPNIRYVNWKGSGRGRISSCGEHPRCAAQRSPGGRGHAHGIHRASLCPDQLHRLQRRGMGDGLQYRQPGLSAVLRRQPRRRFCPCQQHKTC